MGCWSETCAITNLPISAGEEAVLIYLTQTAESGMLARACYVNDILSPSSLPIFGKYDDYGQIDYEETTENLPGILSVYNLMKSLGIEGDDHQQFQEDCERGEVFSTIAWTNDERKYAVIPVLILRKVWDSLVLSPKKSFYHFGKTVVFDEEVSAGCRQIMEWKEGIPGVKVEDKMAYSPSFFERGQPGLAMFFQISSNNIVDRQDNILNLWEETDIPIIDISKSICSMIFLHKLMVMNRRAWHITCGSGTQSEEYDSNIEFYEKAAKIARELKEKHSCDY